MVAFRNFAKSVKNREKETLSWATNGDFFQFLALPFAQLYLLFYFLLLYTRPGPVFSYHATVAARSGGSPPSIHDIQGCTVQ